MGEQGIHHLASAVNDVQHALGQAGFFQQLGDEEGGEGDFLAGFEHERIPAGDGDGIHPQRHHGGKVERRDADAHAQRLADGFAVDAAGNIFQNLTHQQRGNTEGELHHLHPAFHIPARLDQRLAVLAGVAPHDLFEVVFKKDAETPENAGAFDRRRFHPGGEGGLRGLDRGVDLGGRADRASGDDLTGGGIVNGSGSEALLVEPFAADEGWAGCHGISDGGWTNREAPQWSDASRRPEPRIV